MHGRSEILAVTRNALSENLAAISAITLVRRRIPAGAQSAAPADPDSAPPVSRRHAQCLAALDLPLQQFQTHLLYLPVEISTIGRFFAR
jgi:hypothetical protein